MILHILREPLSTFIKYSTTETPKIDNMITFNFIEIKYKFITLNIILLHKITYNHVVNFRSFRCTILHIVFGIHILTQKTEIYVGI